MKSHVFPLVLLSISTFLFLSKVQSLNSSSTPKIFNESKNLSQAFLDCASKCSSSANCLGITVFKYLEQKFSPPSNQYFCITDLNDTNVQESENGTVVYQLTLKNKLRKVVRRPVLHPIVKRQADLTAFSMLKELNQIQSENKLPITNSNVSVDTLFDSNFQNSTNVPSNVPSNVQNPTISERINSEAQTSSTASKNFATQEINDNNESGDEDISEFLIHSNSSAMENGTVPKVQSNVNFGIPGDSLNSSSLLTSETPPINGEKSQPSMEIFTNGESGESTKPELSPIGETLSTAPPVLNNFNQANNNSAALLPTTDNLNIPSSSQETGESHEDKNVEVASVSESVNESQKLSDGVTTPPNSLSLIDTTPQSVDSEPVINSNPSAEPATETSDKKSDLALSGSASTGLQTENVSLATNPTISPSTSTEIVPSAESKLDTSTVIVGSSLESGVPDSQPSSPPILTSTVASEQTSPPILNEVTSLETSGNEKTAAVTESPQVASTLNSSPQEVSSESVDTGVSTTLQSIPSNPMGSEISETSTEQILESEQGGTNQLINLTTISPELPSQTSFTVPMNQTKEFAESSMEGGVQKVDNTVSNPELNSELEGMNSSAISTPEMTELASTTESLDKTTQQGDPSSLQSRNSSDSGSTLIDTTILSSTTEASTSGVSVQTEQHTVASFTENSEFKEEFANKTISEHIEAPLNDSLVVNNTSQEPKVVSNNLTVTESVSTPNPANLSTPLNPEHPTPEFMAGQSLTPSPILSNTTSSTNEENPTPSPTEPPNTSPVNIPSTVTPTDTPETKLAPINSTNLEVSPISTLEETQSPLPGSNMTEGNKVSITKPTETVQMENTSSNVSIGVSEIQNSTTIQVEDLKESVMEDLNVVNVSALNSGANLSMIQDSKANASILSTPPQGNSPVSNLTENSSIIISNDQNIGNENLDPSFTNTTDIDIHELKTTTNPTTADQLNSSNTEIITTLSPLIIPLPSNVNETLIPNNTEKVETPNVPSIIPSTSETNSTTPPSMPILNITISEDKTIFNPEGNIVQLNQSSSVTPMTTPELIAPEISPVTSPPGNLENTISGNTTSETTIKIPISDILDDTTTAGVHVITTDEVCVFEDREKFRRNIMAGSYAVLDGEPTLMSFVEGSSCVATFSKNGHHGIFGLQNLFPDFPRFHQVDAAAYINDTLYLFNVGFKTGQTIYGFKYNTALQIYQNSNETHLTRNSFLAKHCGMSLPSSVQVKAFAQLSSNPNSNSECIIFDMTRLPIISQNASGEIKSLATAINYLLEAEFVPYTEAVFSWLDGPVTTVYVFGSDGELYALHRNLSEGTTWKTGNYEVIPYSLFPV